MNGVHAQAATFLINQRKVARVADAYVGRLFGLGAYMRQQIVLTRRPPAPAC